MKSLRLTLALVWVPIAATAPVPVGAQSAAPAEVLRGRTADVRLEAGGLTGELLAFERDTLWIGGEEGLRGLPLTDVQRIRVHRHGLDGKAVLTWGLVGGGLTALGMTLACSRVEGTDCAAVAGATLLSWAVLGGFFGWMIARTSREEVPASTAGLRPWVRYPGGLPSGQRPGSRPDSSGTAPGGG